MKKYLNLAGALFVKPSYIYVHYGVTHGCNLDCKMCDYWQRSHSDEMELPEIIKMADLLAGLNIFNLSIGGGEPFTRKDLPEILKGFIERNIPVRVLTNGLAPNPVSMKKVFDTGAKNFSFSINSLNPEMQKKIWGVRKVPDNFYGKLIGNLDVFRKETVPKGGMLLLNILITKYNFREIPAVIHFATAIGAQASLLPLEIGDYNMEHAPELKLEEADYPEFRMMMNTVRKMKSKGYSILNSSAYLDLAEKYICGEPFRYDCMGGGLFFSIDPDGAVSVCHMFRHKKYEDGIRHALSPAFRQEAADLVKSCKNLCLRPCWAETSLLFRNLGTVSEMALSQLRNRRMKKAVKENADINKILDESRRLKFESFAG